MASRWQFQGNPQAGPANAVTFGSYLGQLYAVCDPTEPILRLGHGDPSYYPEFATADEARDAVLESVQSGLNNHYPASSGIAPAREALASYLNRTLPVSQHLTPNDVFIGVGCNQGTELIIQALYRPNANILIPRPGYPQFDCRAIYTKVEARKYDLLPEKEWDFDYAGIERLIDENTVAIVIINPHNPCGNVYTAEQLRKVAFIAGTRGILVIADEVYRNIVYGPRPFVPMGSFSHIAPVVTLGALSKGWIVPGWRFGWMAAHDCEGALKDTGVIQSLTDHKAIAPSPTTLLQAALPGIFENTQQEFFDDRCAGFKANAEYFYDLLVAEIPALTVVRMPEACTYLFARLELCRLNDIKDDMDFCTKLAEEENLVFLPGTAVGLSNWIRISIGVGRSVLEEAFRKLKEFYERHSSEPTICPKP